MNNENILAENFFSKLARLIGLSAKEQKALQKRKEIMKVVDDVNSSVSKLEKSLNDVFKQHGKKPVKLSKYKLSDFIK